MRILALDTALEACSVAVIDEDMVIAQETAGMLRGHAEALMPMVARVVEAAGGFADIERLVVAVGPGSFTGLRVAISAARALALGLGKPCIGISTLSAIAAPYLDPADGQPVAAVIDARHGNVYFQLFASNARSLIEARCLPVRDAARMLGGGTIQIAGPGAALLGQEATAMGASFTVVDTRPAADIVWIGILGAAADPREAPPAPLYLKPPDVTPQTGGRVARQ
ncbi:MAG: tRNA (adenosine(37)-N6)-threonylcarbamoyltransferase complex dimerization subunit type 1 TsaB [Labrys sp. (in: a-proteobacteria)]